MVAYWCLPGDFRQVLFVMPKNKVRGMCGVFIRLCTWVGCAGNRSGGGVIRDHTYVICARRLYGSYPALAAPTASADLEADQKLHYLGPRIQRYALSKERAVPTAVCRQGHPVYDRA